MLLPRKKSEFDKRISQMTNDFIDGGTRAVTISLSLYNKNENLFTPMEVSFYFDSTGKLPSSLYPAISSSISF